MVSNESQPRNAAELRRAAERIVEAEALHADVDDLSLEQTRELLHELQVYQVELETQNEELRRVQLELGASKSRYFDLYELAPVGYVTVSTDGLILEANLTAAAMLQKERVQLVKKPLTRFIARKDQDVFYLARKKLIETGSPQRCELGMLRGDSEEPLPVMLEMVIREDAQGASVCHIAMSDITERREAENALREAKREAEQATRAKDQFLAVLSHELRTPLAPVLAAVQLMERKDGISADMRDKLQIIRRNLELEARLIDDLLDLTRVAKGKISLERIPLDIGTVVARVVEVCRSDFEMKGLVLNVVHSGDPLWISGDSSRLQQVVWNLLKNSIKFTPYGGWINIRCSRVENQALVEITDSGVGMESGVLGHIFEAFDQGSTAVTREFGGLGLGLAISKHIVALHGGTISGESPGKGRGATFRVLLPTIAAALEAAPEKQEGERPAPGEDRILQGSRRILLVEDHQDTAMLMQALFKSAGYEVTTAFDAKQARAAIETDYFDLLISDIGLPDEDGHQLMEGIRRSGAVLNGIALSGYGQEDDVRRSREAGFGWHFTKPVDFEALLSTVEAVLAQKTVASD